ncbi:hypothetical protein BT67DRAFT_444018 [Trichocladium antarcticum]|uniref:CCCH zinc finger domain protein n=1 Tax=Trichocladium antarcticum TaxID=1450529 RepID=A0AAN6UG71_9PEZI|nr:hypothetical protein BT67DRAFT_444018 [Trichocladium antarcticum]
MSGRQADTPPYAGLTAEQIRKELTTELPQWIFSSFSPGKDAPEQIFGGYPREQSPEELRLHFMQAAMSGNPQGALNDIQTAYQNAQEQIKHVLSNIPAAIQFVVDAANKHPNRIDICKGAPSGGAPATAANAFQSTPAPVSNPFGAPAAPATTVGGFGQPAPLGQKPNPFGPPHPAPDFARPAQPATPAFGQAPALGSVSPFGRPQATGGFSQPAAIEPKPNPFGAPAYGQSAQPAGAPGAFGQPGFGQTAALGPKPSPFGTPPAGPGAFGVSAGGAGGAQQTPSPFGQPPQPAQTASPFGQPGPNVQPGSNPFGQPVSTPANPFGQPPQPQQPPANPFGNAPASAAAPANSFGQRVSNTQTPANPFGQPTTAPAAAAPAGAFGQPSTSAAGASVGAGAGAPGPYGPDATRQHPDINSYSSRGPDRMLSMFKGKPVTYEMPKGGTKPVPMIRNFDGSMTRIWMPDGAPKYTNETEADPAQYEDPNVQQQWRAFLETGRFADGVMPEVPPKREFCAWDF